MRIDTLRRMPNRGGNPVFEVTFTDGRVARTADGAQVGYLIENSEYRDVDLEVHWHRGEIATLSVSQSSV